MPFASIIAEYFIFWWMTLFVVLPFGLRTQADDNQVVNGSVKSAPARFRPGRIFFLTTLVSACFYLVWYVATVVYGVNALSFPQIVPDFK